MAVCLDCHAPMAQTEATCPKCGNDFSEPVENWWQVILHQSSLIDNFTFMAVLSIPLAYLYYSGSSHPGLIAYGLAWCCHFCGSFTRDFAPLWTRVFNVVGLVSFVSVPLLLIFHW